MTPAARLVGSVKDFRARQVVGRYSRYTTLDSTETGSVIAALVLEEREDGQTVLLAAAKAGDPSVMVGIGKFHHGRGARSSSFKFANGFVFDQVPVDDATVVAIIPSVRRVAPADSDAVSDALVRATRDPTFAFRLETAEGLSPRRIWVREENWLGEKDWESLIRSHIPFPLPPLGQYRGIRRVWTGLFGMLRLTRVQEVLIEFEDRLALWCVDPESPKTSISDDALVFNAALRLGADLSSTRMISRDPSGVFAVVALGVPLASPHDLGRPVIRPV